MTAHRWKGRSRSDALATTAGFAYCAVLTAAAAMLGLLWLRIARAPAPSLATELSLNGLVYGYVFAATAIVFLVLGYVLRRQVDELRRLSSTDPLTGLHNRHALEARLGDEWTAAARTRTPLSLLLIDLDGLKRVNDERGHAAGDRALREVAAAIRMTLRATDLGARWGGDEFAIVAPATPQAAADRLAERLLAHLTRHSRSADVPMTVSVGVSVRLPGDARSPASPDDMMRAADEALYRAKTAGRNQVRVASAERRWACTLDGAAI
jgi:diguanylate cyclase (GGDEF)-like protein